MCSCQLQTQEAEALLIKEAFMSCLLVTPTCQKWQLAMGLTSGQFKTCISCTFISLQIVSNYTDFCLVGVSNRIVPHLALCLFLRQPSVQHPACRTVPLQPDVPAQLAGWTPLGAAALQLRQPTFVQHFRARCLHFKGSAPMKCPDFRFSSVELENT